MTDNRSPKRNLLAGIDRPLKIGTRQSPLAVAQAEMVASAILSAHGWRPDQVELVPMIATGDKIQDRALADLGGKALWTKELDRALHDQEIDCAVHSMKDVETLRPEIFTIAAMLKRADVRDRLVGADSIASLPQAAVVGTASPRRRAQLLRQRPDLDIRLIRGNVQTRLDKIRNGEYTATLLASAGLDRLEMEAVGKNLSIDDMLPAPSQGAIGVETLVESNHIRRVFKEISCTNTSRAVTVERLFLKELTADCHSPVAAYAQVDGLDVNLRVEILLADGSESINGHSDFITGDVAAPARLARKILGQASSELKAVFGR
ncbi:MAG: hydroxymethylbilane synthase [Parasphingorhabdus sp.]|uniref:hydroxymethylbilane synthase n=1 Tax=Parasphingorhabdus sp. TaxID=2709688 RepID=UPI00329780F8